MLPKDFSLDLDTDLQILFFDVGQADSILISDNGTTLLIDAGNYEDGPYITEYLKQLGITKIDYLIGTHAHEDHIGGMGNIIDNFEIGYFIMPESPSNITIKAYKEMEISRLNKDLPVTTPNIGDTFNIGDAVCVIKFVDNNLPRDINNASIILEMSLGEQSYLFMGDAGSSVEKNKSIEWQKTEVLKVGHHGSETASKITFITAISPEIAIISVGTNNLYKLPKDSVINILRDFCGNNIFRTDIDGTIYMKNVDGENIVQLLKTNIDGNKK